MASSGTFAFAPSNGEIVLAAYRRIRARAPELRQEHMVAAQQEINFLFSEWSNQQVNLWEVVRTQTVLTPGTATYSLTPQTILVLDASIVLNFGTTTEARRFIPPVSRTEYLSFPNQQIQAPPTTYWFDRLISPTITFWPVPDNNGPYTFDYYSVTQIQDANLPGGETPNIPYRWIDAMVAGLAYRLSRIYPPEDEPNKGAFEARREQDYLKAWQVAATQDTEPVNLSLVPMLGGYYRR